MLHATARPTITIFSATGRTVRRKPAGKSGLWARLSDEMLAHMSKISLASLVDEQLALGVSVESRPPRRVAAPIRSAVPVGAPNSVFALGRSLAS